MSDKRADKLRYWLTYLLDDLPVGGTFKPSALHLTIIPWFVTEMVENEVIGSFIKTFSGLPAIELTVGKEDEFKHKRRILINHIGPREKIVPLHDKALEWFLEIEARWAVEKPHVGDEFIPHIRRRDGKNVDEASKFLISSLSLVKARRRGDEYREVAAKVNFK